MRNGCNSIVENRIAEIGHLGHPHDRGITSVAKSGVNSGNPNKNEQLSENTESAPLCATNSTDSDFTG